MQSKTIHLLFDIMLKLVNILHPIKHSNKIVVKIVYESPRLIDNVQFCMAHWRGGIKMCVT